MYNKNNIINYEIMSGWPIYKKTLRDIIEDLGFKHEEGVYILSDKSPILDIYPSIFHDDGMGYGVNEEFFTEVNSHPNSDKVSKDIFVNFFAESKLNNIELWEKCKLYPGCSVVIKDDSPDEFLVFDIKEENSEVYLFCERFNKDNDNKDVCLWINLKLISII